jgi:VWFA-related protein
LRYGNRKFRATILIQMAKLRILSELIVSALALQGPSQNPYSFSTQSNLVIVPTQVTTQQGDFIYGLQGRQFVITDNGVPQRVHLEEAPDQTGLSLAVVVQCSGASAMEASKLTGLSTMIEDISGAASHEVAVLSYGTQSSLLTDFTSDPAKVRAAISAIKPCAGRVATLDAVDHAANLLEWRQNHYRRAILLISETRDHGSHATAEEVIEELGRTNTVVNAVAYSPGRDEFLSQLKSNTSGSTGTMDLMPILLMAINAMRDNTASELADLSGGQYQNFTTRKGLDSALGHIANQIHNFYLLSFRPQGQPTPGYHKLQVFVPEIPNAQVRCRSSFWSEAIQPAEIHQNAPP